MHVQSGGSITSTFSMSPKLEGSGARTLHVRVQGSSGGKVDLEVYQSDSMAKKAIKIGVCSKIQFGTRRHALAEEVHATVELSTLAQCWEVA